MMKIWATTVGVLTLVLWTGAVSAETVSFKAKDGLMVSADLDQVKGDVAIVLFHMAGSSRGEYIPVVPRLNALGYTTLAVDQRSGESNAGVVNLTFQAAKSAGKATGFVDAMPDLEAAIAYARALNGVEKVVIWGSSYSASLSLVLAGTKPDLMDGVLVFSPAEYLNGNPSVEQSVGGIKVPTFVTSAKPEADAWSAIHKAIPASVAAVGFVPKGRGQHGSSALNAKLSPNPEEYWTEIEVFLSAHF